MRGLDIVFREYYKKIIIILIFFVICVCMYDEEKMIIHTHYPNASVYRIHKAETNNIVRLYKIIEDNRVSKVAQVVQAFGYKSKIELLVIIDTTVMRVDRVLILEEHESENYGEYIREEWFLERFEGKGVLLPIHISKIRAEKDNEVVIVTGATISSAAVVHGVNLCLENYQSMIQ